MPEEYKLDPVRADIFASLEKVFEVGRVLWKAKFNPMLAHKDRFNILVTAAEGDKFNIKPTGQNLAPGYICSVGKQCACYIKMESVDGKISDTQICVEVSVSMWEKCKDDILTGMDIVMGKIPMKPAEVRADKVKRNQELIKQLKPKVQGDGITLELNDNSDIIIELMCFKNLTHEELIAFKGMFEHLFTEDAKAKYQLCADTFKDGVGWDHFDVKIILTDSYVAGSDLAQIAGDILALGRTLELTYQKALSDYIAAKYYAEHRDFDSDTANTLIDAVVVLLQDKEMPFRVRFNYLEDEGYFALNLDHDVVLSTSQTLEPMIHAIAWACRDNGFLITMGINNINLIPVKGEFDYAKTLPQVCDFIINEVVLFADIFRSIDSIFRRTDLPVCNLSLGLVEGIDGRKDGKYSIIIDAPPGMKFGDQHYRVDEIVKGDDTRIDSVDVPHSHAEEITRLCLKISLPNWEENKGKIIKFVAKHLDEVMTKSKANIHSETAENLARKKQELCARLKEEPKEKLSMCNTTWHAHKVHEEFLVTINCVKTSTYSGFDASLKMLMPAFEMAGVSYDVLHLRNREVYGDFNVTIKLYDSYLAGNKVNEVGRRICDEMSALAHLMELTYYNALTDSVAGAYGKKAAKFDDELGKRMVEQHAGLFKYSEGPIPVAGATATCMHEAVYSDYIQAFVLLPFPNTLWHIDYEACNTLMKDQLQYACSLGFAIFQGGENEIILKPLAGDYDYEKNYQILGNALTKIKAGLFQDHSVPSHLKDQRGRG